MKNILILSFFLFLSCSSNRKLTSSEYKVLFSNENGLIENKEFILVDNYNEYIKIIEQLKIDASNYNKLLEIDFNKNNICFLFLGQRKSGGYSIEVESIKKKEKDLYIKIKENTPSRSDFVTTAITNPYCIVVLPKFNTLFVK